MREYVVLQIGYHLPLVPGGCLAYVHRLWRKDLQLSGELPMVEIRRNWTSLCFCHHQGVLPWATVFFTLSLSKLKAYGVHYPYYRFHYLILAPKPKPRAHIHVYIVRHLGRTEYSGKRPFWHFVV